MAAPGQAVSVVIPCFRCAGTIARAVHSAIAQTLPPLEIILVDDASPDDTFRVLESLRDKYGPNVIKLILLPENRGPSAARNAGWDAARGELMAFLDADDSWHPRKLELQTAIMAAHPEAAVSGHLHAVGSEPIDPESPQVAVITPEALLWRNRFVTPSAMVRRRVAQRFREAQRHMEDHLLWMQIAFAGERVLLIEAALATLHKPIFGASGLSAELLAMERAGLRNYLLLWRAGHIGLARLAVLWTWSALKFGRRIAIVGWRRLAG